ncbi:transposase [Rathayibacter iranicus]|uniref:Transposase n=1 Tax=Rathayibacter iranicus NCPPB 2253 = VKM Ac-1602 TaxID=1328868 RepID=A0ABX5LCE5_9MICO|nr:transposase [Rathayibacter iranicus] [Rathayibacter iranicus NCPPB 2253 = VKM Ac-1602]
MVQRTLGGSRSRDPLYSARRTLHTGADLLTDKQHARLKTVFAVDEHVEVEATWGIYQRMIAAYRDPDRTAGRTAMQALIDSISSKVPRALKELVTLGRTMNARAADILAYFDRPGTSNGRPKRSTAASNTSAAPPWASATSPPTSPAACSKLASSDPDYTLNYDEPKKAKVSTVIQQSEWRVAESAERRLVALRRGFRERSRIANTERRQSVGRLGP